MLNGLKPKGTNSGDIGFLPIRRIVASGIMSSPMIVACWETKGEWEGKETDSDLVTEHDESKFDQLAVNGGVLL